MDTRRLRKANRGFNVVVISFVAVLFVLFFLIWIDTGSATRDLDSTSTSLQYNWNNADGSHGDLDVLEGEQSFFFALDGSSIEGRDLCFRTKNTNFKVYLDDELIYRYEPEVPVLYGRSYGTFFHSIPLPEYEGVRTLRIDTHAEYSGGNGFIKECQLQYGSRYLVKLYAENTPNFLLAVFMFAIGVILMLGGAAVAGSSSKGREIISMGLFTVLSSSWIASETAFFQLSSNNPAAVHFMSYILLILLPGSAMLFIRAFAKRNRSLICKVMIWMSLFLCFTDVAFTLIGIADYHDMIVFTQIHIGAAIVVSSVSIVIAVKRREIQRRATRLLVAAFFLAIAGASIDLWRYICLDVSADKALFFRIGILAFVVIMSAYEARELYKYRRYAMEADTMRKLAHTDALTGIENRMAFTEYENNIREQSSEDILLVQLDINFLKRVNDEFGHVEGDKHIAAAASIISDCFGGSGRVFRTGGDEFIATVEGLAGKAKYDEAINKMEQEIAKYNKANKPPIPLQIAYGMAEYTGHGKNPEEVLKEADTQMYLMKTRMKEEKE
ncbi:diguanylate cyclase (GGDEF) domain-containing protein [Oscillospiraceae bacterium]|nr:diguanylate cyclase (GGDEF) domain-containing protein [Oscillospiraceae bacterium]